MAERLLEALREVRPRNVRQFFALANQHMRWELNDLARRLDEQPVAAELREELVPSPASSVSGSARSTGCLRTSGKSSTWSASRG